MDSLKAFDTAQLWSKCVSIHPELMFTRSTYGTPDMIEQHRLLSETADLVDRGVVAHDDDEQPRPPERRDAQARARPARERHDHRQGGA